MESLQLELFDFATMTLDLPSENFVEEKPVVILADEAECVRENYRIAGDDILVVPGKKKKVAANIAAIETLERLENSGEEPDRKNCAALVRYCGWGGIPQIFDSMNDDFVDEYIELKNLLNQDEYEAARASTLTSHYTPREIIDLMWRMVIQCGFSGGTIGEFGAGTGHFIGLLPEVLTDKCKFTAVELDMISARILKMLYPQTALHIGSLEKVSIRNNSLDLVIGNVPYAKQGVYDRLYPNYNLHNYFIARALDALKPGGVAILLTSNSTLDSVSTKARENFFSRAALIAAYRLPNNTFLANAGTEVVADLLILQKGAKEIHPCMELVEVETADNTGSMRINEYFALNPGHVLGKLSNTGKMYGKQDCPTVLPVGDTIEILERQISSIQIQDIKADVPEVKTDDIEPKIRQKEYAVFEQDGRLYQCLQGCGIRLMDRNDKPLSTNEIQKIRSFIQLKECLNELLRMQLDEYTGDEQLVYQRKKLNELYDSHVRRYNFLSNKLVHRLMTDDPDYLKLAATEYPKDIIETSVHGVKTKRRTYIKGDVYHKRTQFPWVEPARAENVVEAGLISYAYRNRIDLNYIARLTGNESQLAVKDELLQSGEFFENPEHGKLELRSEYLSGHVKRKLETAKQAAAANPQFAQNVKALAEVQPKPLHIEDIDFELGTFWIPASVIQRWIKIFLNCETEVVYHRLQDRWKVKPDSRSRYMITEYRAGSMDAFDIIELTLNLKDPVITKKVIVDGEEKQVIDKEETLSARQIKNELRQNFHSFVLDDLESNTEIETVYNERFNSHVLRKYELPKFDIYPGAVSIINGKKFILREHQKRAVSRCIEGNCLLAHCVGAGKTAIMVTLALELVRLKLSSKNLIVVQNATLSQFAEFAPKLYPDAKILIADKKDLIRERRKKFMTRIATFDWDIIIMAQSSFDMIENRPEDVADYFREQIEELEAIIEEVKGDSLSVKEMERQKKGLEAQLAKLNDKKTVEDIVYFDELGITSIIVDEAQAYRRNFFVTKMQRVKGLNRGASQRAFSLTLKLRHIRRKTGGRNIYFATATPIVNGLAELWAAVRYVSPETLADYGIETFDRFASSFTATETALEIDAAGRLRMIERFSRYMNVIELSKMFQAVADVILEEDLSDVERPNIKGGSPTHVAIPRSPVISKFMEYLSSLYQWFEGLSGSRKADYSHIPLLIFGMSRKVTIDPRLVNIAFGDDPQSKLNVCLENIRAKYDEYADIRGAQIVFSDLYQLTVKGEVLFNAWQELKNKLIERGIPAEEIAVISDYNTDTRRAEVFAKVNSGEVRVIIGSTGKLGTGVNIQERLAVAHFLDTPFTPADMTQRIGRIVRQGNCLLFVQIFYYGVSETLDAGMYQILTRKQRFINDGMKGRGGRHMNEIHTDAALDYATFSAAISGNEKLKRKVLLETRSRELESLEIQFRRTIRRNAEMKRELEQKLPQLAAELESLEKFIAHIPDLTGELEVILNNRPITGTRAEQLEAIHQYFLHQGSYRALSLAKAKQDTINHPFGVISINGLNLSLTAVCKYSMFVGAGTPTIEYRLTDYSFGVASVNSTGTIASATGLMSSLTSLLTHKPAELIEAEKLQNSMIQKLQNLNTSQEKTFPHNEEKLQVTNELDQLIMELNKSGEFVQNQRFERMPLLTDFFPNLKTEEPITIIGEIIDTESDPEEKCA